MQPIEKLVHLVAHPEDNLYSNALHLFHCGGCSKGFISITTPFIHWLHFCTILLPNWASNTHLLTWSRVLVRGKIFTHFPLCHSFFVILLHAPHSICVREVILFRAQSRNSLEYSSVTKNFQLTLFQVTTHSSSGAGAWLERERDTGNANKFLICLTLHTTCLVSYRVKK